MRQEAFELHALLEAAKISGPVVLVGQSIGCLLARRYVAEYGRDVVGLVLVDPTHESAMLGSLRYGGWVRLREKAKGRPIPAPRLKSDPSPDTDPADDFMAEEFQGLYLERQTNATPFGDRPLIVLGAGKRSKPPGTSDEMWRQLRQEREAQVRDMTNLSRNSKLVVDPQSGHAMHHDNPQLIANSIVEILEAAAKGIKLTPRD
jgi:pimeloyl-ACP methyl ester carboxylesterase